MTKKVAFYSNMLLLLTSVHHVYGAYIYDTPWRLHILAFAIPIIGYNVLVSRNILNRKLWRYLFWFVNIVYSVILIGLYEGLYNHLMKVVLYYTVTSQEIMLRLFPPPTYEMPNDFLFEFTGVLQAFVLIPLVYYCMKSVRKKV